MSDAWTPGTGDTVDGRYQVTGFLGSGGFAKAWSATDPTGSPVALKHPNYESSNDKSVVDRYFEKEVETLRRVRDAGGHMNVMGLHEVVEDRGTTFLVVELVDGTEMNAVVDEEGPMTDWERVRRIGIDLCDAMSFLHQNEIIYRDLKPENVMLTRDYAPRLIDFNTAKGFDGEGSSDGGTVILGPFKPVEVTEASQSDARQGPWSDVYSIGKILVYLMKGSVPEMDGIDPREIGVDCPAYLAEIVERATATDHEDRYRNATVLGRVLENRDPQPPPEARLEHVQAGETMTVGPGDTIGRRDAEGPSPSVAIDDPRDDYVSAVQAQFDHEDGEWILRDRSLNGTYVQHGDGWQRVLCESGRQRLERKGADPTDSTGERPPEKVVVERGDLIALVDPGYGVTFEFKG